MIGRTPVQLDTHTHTHLHFEQLSSHAGLYHTAAVHRSPPPLPQHHRSQGQGWHEVNTSFPTGPIRGTQVNHGDSVGGREEPAQGQGRACNLGQGVLVLESSAGC